MDKVIALDSPIIIYAWESNPAYVKSAHKLLRKIESGEFVALFSVIGMIEVLTGPKKAGDFRLAQQYKELLISYPHLQIISLNEDVIDIASDLRAKYNLATPDAIHIATAIYERADVFVTNDKALKKVKEISIKLLNEVV